MPRKDRSTELLVEVLKTSQILGTEATKKIISDARERAFQQNLPMAPEEVQRLEENEERTLKGRAERAFNYTIKSACKKFDITIAELKNGTGRGERIIAQMVCCMALKKVYDLSAKKIAHLLNKDPRNTRKLFAEYSALDKEHRFDKIIIDKCDSVVEKSKDYLKKTNQDVTSFPYRSSKGSKSIK